MAISEPRWIPWISRCFPPSARILPQGRGGGGSLCAGCRGASGEEGDSERALVTVLLLPVFGWAFRSKCLCFLIARLLLLVAFTFVPSAKGKVRGRGARGSFERSACHFFVFFLPFFLWLRFAMQLPMSSVRFSRLCSLPLALGPARRGEGKGEGQKETNSKGSVFLSTLCCAVQK